MIEELKKKHLEAIENSKDHVINYFVGDGHGENVWQVQEDVASKEATNITLSFCIDVLKDLHVEDDMRHWNALMNKIQELEKLIENV